MSAIHVEKNCITQIEYDFSKIKNHKEAFITIAKTRNLIHSNHRIIIEFCQKKSRILFFGIHFESIIKVIIHKKLFIRKIK
jgi:hypothetical protein